MLEQEIRLSEYVMAENDNEDEGIVLKARAEAGRGKRFGMDGEISLSSDEAETFAKWVFAHGLEQGER